jgi:hypothetical protein
MGMWWEFKVDKMEFKDNKGNSYPAVYKDGWWRARVPAEKVLRDSEFWPCELIEGSGQYVHSCEVKKRAVPSHWPWPEPEIEEEPEGVVTPFAVLGDEDDRPIEEVKAEMKKIVEEVTETKPKEFKGIIDTTALRARLAKIPVEAKSDPIVETGLPPLDIGPLPDGPAISKVKEEPPEPELEWEPPEPPKPKKRSRKKKKYVCPVCGVTTTKGGKLFVSPRSVVIHARMAHGERLKEADIKKG